jgi:hypothetical protein
MSKKSDKGTGVSLSPEFGEIVRRLKDKEPELDEIVNRGGAKGMPDKVIEKMDSATKEIRINMRALMIDKGFSEEEALRQALPKDRNRTKKLRRWKEHGLWPISASEQARGSVQRTEPAEVETDNAPETAYSSDSPVNTVKPCIDTEAELLEKIRAMLDTIQPAERPVGATAKGRHSPLKTKLVALRLPVTLNEELKALGGLKSRHIEKALMLYLRAMKGVRNDEG